MCDAAAATPTEHTQTSSHTSRLILAIQHVTNTFSKTPFLTHSVVLTPQPFSTSQLTASEKRGAGVELPFHYPGAGFLREKRCLLTVKPAEVVRERAGPQRLYGDLRPKTTRQHTLKNKTLHASLFGPNPHP